MLQDPNMLAQLRKNLINLAVFTQSGISLGKISDIEIETESQTILRYEVKKNFFDQPLLIHRDQVISINAKSMVVEDTAVKEIEKGILAKTPNLAKKEIGVVTKEID